MSRRFGTVDQMGEDVLRADVMGVDVLKLDVMAQPRIFSILCRFLLQISDYHHLWYCFYANCYFMVVIYWISKMRKVWNKTIDCTARQCSPLRRKFMECYIIKPDQSLLMKHLVIGQRLKAPDFSAFHWSPRGNMICIDQHFVITRVVHLPKSTETSLIT